MASSTPTGASSRSGCPAQPIHFRSASTTRDRSSECLWNLSAAAARVTRPASFVIPVAASSPSKYLAHSKAPRRPGTSTIQGGSSGLLKPATPLTASPRTASSRPAEASRKSTCPAQPIHFRSASTTRDRSSGLLQTTASSRPAEASRKSMCPAHPLHPPRTSTVRGRSSVFYRQQGHPRLLGDAGRHGLGRSGVYDL